MYGLTIGHLPIVEQSTLPKNREVLLSWKLYINYRDDEKNMIYLCFNWSMGKPNSKRKPIDLLQICFRTELKSL